MESFKQFLAIKKIRVEAPESMLPPVPDQLDEATKATVGRTTARRDPPHFQGDEYHGHADLPGGYQVSWGVSGKRRHPNKFPETVPANAKAAVAKVLGVHPDLLESCKILDEKIGEEVYLIELKDADTQSPPKPAS